MAAPKNSFTKEQIITLKSNPNVAMVDSWRVFFTAEFKERFWKLYTLEYMRPREALERLGMDAEMLGAARVRGIAQNIKKEYEQYGKFSDSGRAGTSKAERKQGNQAILSPEEEARRLRIENEYLKQELEFVKKIVAVGGGAKR